MRFGLDYRRVFQKCICSDHHCAAPGGLQVRTIDSSRRDKTKHPFHLGKSVVVLARQHCFRRGGGRSTRDPTYVIPAPRNRLPIPIGRTRWRVDGSSSSSAVRWIKERLADTDSRRTSAQSDRRFARGMRLGHTHPTPRGTRGGRYCRAQSGRRLARLKQPHHEPQLNGRHLRQASADLDQAARLAALHLKAWQAGAEPIQLAQSATAWQSQLSSRILRSFYTRCWRTSTLNSMALFPPTRRRAATLIV